MKLPENRVIAPEKLLRYLALATAQSGAADVLLAMDRLKLHFAGFAHFFLASTNLFHLHRHERRVVFQRFIVGEMLHAAENGVDEVGQGRLLPIG